MAAPESILKTSSMNDESETITPGSSHKPPASPMDEEEKKQDMSISEIEEMPITVPPTIEQREALAPPTAPSPMADEEKPQDKSISEIEEMLITVTPQGDQLGEPAPPTPPSPPPSKYYVEETAWRLHGGRSSIHGSCIDQWQLDPLPEAPPIDVSAFPKSGRWTFDEETRVVYGDFRNCHNAHDGQARKQLDPEDEHFLLKTMERDDVTVVTEGFAAHLNPKLWTLNVLKEIVGNDVCHQFRVFERIIERHPINNGAEGTYENVQWFESYKEHANCLALQMKDFVRYIYQRMQQLECIAHRRTEAGVDPSVALDPEQEGVYRIPEEENFVYKNAKGVEQTFNCINTVLYMIDYDVGKLVPILHQDFVKNFLAPSLLPGSQYCMMHELNAGGRPFMGPNLYMTPPGSFTHFHQDGHGTVDSGHQCLSGYNEVVMLRRMTETHKQHAIYLLNGKDPTYYEALYGLPHAEGARTEMPRWPTCEDIQGCKNMNYYPSVFILKPGQFVHINKGRLHAFRKLAPTPLPDHDCHAKLREEMLRVMNGNPRETLCLSVAWDWTYRGITAEAVNREVSSMLECAALNREHNTQSLAIPETCLLHTAKALLAQVKAANKPDDEEARWDFLPSTVQSVADNASFSLDVDAKEILKGILPSLHHLVRRHKAAVDKARGAVTGPVRNGASLSIAKLPDSWENPQCFSVDPYGNDFFCKLCSDELSNVYMHCEGCEKILNKDFNICVSCHSEGRQKSKVQMHPLNDKNHSTINHTGNYKFSRQSRCPCKNGPVCKNCSYCAGCSCKCHQFFTLRHRFMEIESEESVLRGVQDTIGSHVLPFASETVLKLEYFRPIAAGVGDAEQTPHRDSAEELGEKRHPNASDLTSRKRLRRSGLPTSDVAVPQLHDPVQLHTRTEREDATFTQQQKSVMVIASSRVANDDEQCRSRHSLLNVTSELDHSKGQSDSLSVNSKTRKVGDSCKRARAGAWTASEMESLTWAVDIKGKDWIGVAKLVVSRNSEQCRKKVDWLRRKGLLSSGSDNNINHAKASSTDDGQDNQYEDLVVGLPKGRARFEIHLPDAINRDPEARYEIDLTEFPQLKNPEEPQHFIVVVPRNTDASDAAGRSPKTSRLIPVSVDDTDVHNDIGISSYTVRNPSTVNTQLSSGENDTFNLRKIERGRDFPINRQIVFQPLPGIDPEATVEFQLSCGPELDKTYCVNFGEIAQSFDGPGQQKVLVILPPLDDEVSHL